MSERLAEREHRSPYRDRTLTDKEFQDFKAASNVAFNDLATKLQAVTLERDALREQRDASAEGMKRLNDENVKLNAQIATLNATKAKATIESHKSESVIPNAPITDKLAGRDNSMAGTGVEQGEAEKKAGPEAVRQKEREAAYHEGEQAAHAAASNMSATEQERAEMKRQEEIKRKQEAEPHAQAKPGSPHPAMDKQLGADNSMAGTGVAQGPDSERKAKAADDQLKAQEKEKAQADAEAKRRRDAAHK